MSVSVFIKADSLPDPSPAKEATNMAGWLNRKSNRELKALRAKRLKDAKRSGYKPPTTAVGRFIESKNSSTRASQAYYGAMGDVKSIDEELWSR